MLVSKRGVGEIAIIIRTSGPKPELKSSKSNQFWTIKQYSHF